MRDLYRKCSFSPCARRRLWRRLCRFGGYFLFLCVTSLGVLIFSRDAWGALDMQKLNEQELSLAVYDGSGELYSLLYLKENRLNVAIETLPKYVTDAFVAAEDARFWTHPGFDPVRIVGAAWNDLKAGSYVEGASTITQQLIKLTHLTDEKSMERKLDEAILAWQLEQQLNKEAILELYLNTVYFGKGCYGIEAAALGYFGVRAKDLTLAQSALLAGVLKSPARFAPHLRPEASVGRRGVILDLMAEYGFIDASQAAEAKEEPLILSPSPCIGRRGYYVDLVLTESCDALSIGMDELLTGGYSLYTTLEPKLQALCETAFSNDDYFPVYEGESAQGAIVIVDAQTGGVAALIGGRDSDVALAYDRATRIRMQPGSAIKPILVYAPALEAGYTAASMLLDEQTSFGDYTPRNASGSYSGWVTMRQAVTRSLNIPAVALFSALGTRRCIAFAKRLGIEFDALDSRLALALGGFTYGVSPWQLAGAYAALAGGGIYHTPHVLLRILNDADTLLYMDASEATRVLSEGNAYVLTSMLMSVAEEGTAKRLGELGFDLAAKTGTVGDALGNRDIWLCAYTKDYAACVWMGFDDSSGGKTLPADSGGGSYPALLLSSLFSSIYADREPPVFTRPKEVAELSLDKRALTSEHEALLATELTPESERVSEVFVSGTEPTLLSDYWSVPLPPTDLSALRNEDGSVTIHFTPPSDAFVYRLYRADSKGFAVLLGSFTGSALPQSLLDPAAGLCGLYRYYVVPVHPELRENGAELCGERSNEALVWLYG